MPSVVAVSNSVAAAKLPLGRVIDSFDHVVRFNSFLLEPFIGHVGQRTTIWVASDCTAGSNPSLRSRKVFFAPRRKRAVVRVPCGFEVISAEIDRQFSQEAQLSIGTHPTTGMIGLYYLMKQFPIIHTGGWFRGRTCSQPGAFLQQYGRPFTKATRCAHDLEAESRLFVRWQRAGRVVPLDD